MPRASGIRQHGLVHGVTCEGCLLEAWPLLLVEHRQVVRRYFGVHDAAGSRRTKPSVPVRVPPSQSRTMVEGPTGCTSRNRSSEPSGA